MSSDHNIFSGNPGLVSMAVKAAGIGVWEIDISRKLIMWDEQCCKLMSLNNEFTLSFDEAFRNVNEPERSAVLSKLSEISAGNNDETFDAVCRITSVNNDTRWIKLTGTLAADNTKKIRFAGAARDVTKSIIAQQKAEHSQEELLSLFDQSPVAIATISRDNLTFTNANTFYGELVGRKPKDIIGKPLLEALPELAGQGFDELLNGVIRTGIPFKSDSVSVELLRNGKIETIYVNLAYQPIKDKNDEVTSIFVVATDITPQVKANKAIEEARSFGELLGNSVPAMIFYMDREERYTTYNDTFMEWFNVEGKDAIGKTAKEFIGETAYQRVKPYLKRAYSGERVQYQMPAPSRIGTQRWLNIVYTPHKNEEGEVVGIIVHATDVTDIKQTEIALRESEEKFRSLIHDAPFATSLYVGEELIIDTANEAMITLWGKTPGVLGMPLADALPELKGQPFIEILREVRQSGIAYHAHAQAADLVINGKLQRSWFNFTYKPLFDGDGKVYAILNMAVDVSEMISNQRKVQESETRLKALISSAPTPIAIFLGEDLIIDLPNQAFIDVVSKGPDIAGRPFGEVMPELAGEGQPFLDILKDIYHNGTTFRADGALARIMVDGELVDKYFNITFSPLRDSKGNIYGILDISIEVTDAVLAQRKIAENEKALEIEVQTRTEELAAAIEELRSTNEELGYSNDQLVRSNDDLTQYAYVASHDLQEPLRKIQVFANLLQTGHHVSDDGNKYLSKIIESAERMRLLIRDLLNFSRLLQSDSSFQEVDLNETINNVIADFELMANEKGAVFSLASMPKVEAVGLQMNQLFYNLISNSLKFSRPEVKPVISVTAHLLTDQEVISYIQNPVAATKYYKICIHDNGIGFESKYAEQIFEVFKRLHARDVYPGSGIGLALCRKIIDNHSGILYTESTPGAGTTFCFILPEKQPDEVEQ